MEQKQVVIVGGGPAGAAAALTLENRGINSLILEASTGMKLKVGETLPPTVLPVLKVLGMDSYLHEPDHLFCYGNKYVWGGEEVKEKLFVYNTNGDGWHLNRSKFETQLYRLTQEKEVEWRLGSKLVKAVPGKDNDWNLTIAHNSQQYELKACFLVDATGRASYLSQFFGTRQEEFDRLVGVVYLFTVNRVRDIPHYTHIEAVENGWWYAALLPDNRLITAFMTDADLVDKAMLYSGHYWEALKNTRLISALVPDDPGRESARRTFIRKASSSCLDKVFGDNWLAVGDAAFAYDPVSSYGIASALGGGFYAGNAIADHLNRKPEALPAHHMVCEKAYQFYREMLSVQYRLEQRWPDSIFWKRRHLLE